MKLEFSPLWATFTVRDTGVGIPSEDIDKSKHIRIYSLMNFTLTYHIHHAVFDRFHRVEAVSRSHEGTGIGLALTKELVRLHGGQLSVTSTPQRHSNEHNDGELPHGSMFTVTIPMGHSHIPKTYVDETLAATTGAPRTYARGIIDEAAQYVISQITDSASDVVHPDRWGRVPTYQLEVTTPSDTSDGGSGSYSSGDSGTLFFKKTDVVLVGKCSASFLYDLHGLYNFVLHQWTIMYVLSFVSRRRWLIQRSMRCRRICVV